MRFILKSFIVIAIASYFMPQGFSHASNDKELSLLSEAGGAISTLFRSFSGEASKQIITSAISSKLSNGAKSRGTLTENDLLTPWQGGKNRLSQINVK